MDVPGFDILFRGSNSAISPQIQHGIAGERNSRTQRTLEGAMEAEDQGSVTIWIAAVRAGDQEAASQLWRRYFESLVRLARSKLQSKARRAADEEDVALCAFDSFYGGMARGRFPDIADRHDLWRLLVTIAARKASDQNRWESQQKRGGGRVVRESDLMAGPEPEWDALAQIVGAEPSPEFAAMVADECGTRLQGLPDESLRQVALLKMEGYLNEEIAARLGCGLRTVARKLEFIRNAWQDEALR
jgi:DNA-directed RNA polymerase specialized sigma24 family protein